MARIRGKDTKPELRLRSILWRLGLRYRLKAKVPAGRPDLVFPREKVAVFVDGCFWHGCPEHYVRPRSRNDFWSAKLLENVQRDSAQTLALERHGWRVVRIWEHEIDTNPSGVEGRIRTALGQTRLSSRPEWRVLVVEPIAGVELELERRVLGQLRNLARRKVSTGHRHTTKWRRRGAR